MIELIYYKALLINSIIILPYLFLLALKFSAARLKVFAAVFLCIIISHTPVYLMVNNVERYSFLALVYVITCQNVTNKKVSASCCIMAIFEFLMVLDRYVNAGFETWLYIYFEEITIVIHSLIISSFFKWELTWWRGFLGAINDHVRRLLRNMRVSLRI